MKRLCHHFNEGSLEVSRPKAKVSEHLNLWRTREEIRGEEIALLLKIRVTRRGPFLRRYVGAEHSILVTQYKYSIATQVRQNNSPAKRCLQ
jgi:hypothetical protein